MPERGPWTLDSLERALRKALSDRASLRVKKLPLSRSADVEWVEPHGRARVQVDDHEVTVRSGAIHELLHVVLHGDLAAFGDDTSEEIICSLESAIDRRISLSNGRRAWWRKAIKGKLPK